ncbi:MAG TPA: DUF1127 domain-containing protein [Pseudolabrys sp.]|jgi:uncharacterized protein YjiS (DUF1127 family)|nr:DUF1127 domain-containing protein [Pseudolabrys sp.]
MSANIPVLPLAGATALRGSFAVLALVTRWCKALVRAQRHRRAAYALAKLDSHMLADIGLTHSDVSDAFASRFWQDPTDLLIERQRSHKHNIARAVMTGAPDDGFCRPALDRPARQTM